MFEEKSCPKYHTPTYRSNRLFKPYSKPFNNKELTSNILSTTKQGFNLIRAEDCLEPLDTFNLSHTPSFSVLFEDAEDFGSLPALLPSLLKSSEDPLLVIEDSLSYSELPRTPSSSSTSILVGGCFPNTSQLFTPTSKPSQNTLQSGQVEDFVQLLVGNDMNQMVQLALFQDNYNSTPPNPFSFNRSPNSALLTRSESPIPATPPSSSYSSPSSPISPSFSPLENNSANMERIQLSSGFVPYVLQDEIYETLLQQRINQENTFSLPEYINDDGGTRQPGALYFVIYKGKRGRFLSDWKNCGRRKYDTKKGCSNLKMCYRRHKDLLTLKKRVVMLKNNTIISLHHIVDESEHFL